MPRVSTIKRLPDDILEKMHELLRDARCTQLDITAQINTLLEQKGHDGRVSKSAVGRYALDMEEAGAHLRESREMAKQWIGTVGSAPQGEVGLYVNEIIRTLSLDVSLMMRRGVIDAETAPDAVKMLKDLALTTMRLEKATSDNVKRAAEIKKQAMEEAADKVSEVAKQEGVSAETIQRIRRDVLMMAT
jgi:Protein of unknown function (DUF3486)